MWLEFEWHGYWIYAALHENCWDIDMLYPGDEQPGASIIDMANLDKYLSEQAGRLTITWVTVVRRMTDSEREKYIEK